MSNDPELDARLVLEALENQLGAFVRLNGEEPDALTAYHFQTTRAEGAAGFDAVFRYVRAAHAPTSAAAEAAILRMLGPALRSPRDRCRGSRASDGLQPALRARQHAGLSALAGNGGHARDARGDQSPASERSGPRIVVLVRLRCLSPAAGR